MNEEESEWCVEVWKPTSVKENVEERLFRFVMFRPVSLEVSEGSVRRVVFMCP